MPSPLSPTDVAFTMAALMQAVLLLFWRVGAAVAAEPRRATLSWAAYAGLSALSFVLLVEAMHGAGSGTADVLRAGGNLVQLVGIVALQRGIRLYIGQAAPGRGHAAAIVVVLVSSWIGLDPAQGALRVGVNSTVLTVLCLAMALELHRHARDTLGLRWPVLLALPLVFGALGFAQRGLRAFADPAAVPAQMTGDSAQNVASALAYVVVALAFHAVLVTLVVARLLAAL
ncbi:MAG: hypothetical protein HY020_06675, partial [Burkholderiales bacterium]|nr:hypothetical protein [Burkholderiales bacterium]